MVRAFCFDVHTQRYVLRRTLSRVKFTTSKLSMNTSGDGLKQFFVFYGEKLLNMPDILGYTNRENPLTHLGLSFLYFSEKYERPHVVCNCVRACFAISCSAFVRTAGRLNCLLRVRLALVGNQQAQHLQPVVAGNLLVQLALLVARRQAHQIVQGLPGVRRRRGCC